MGWLKVGRDRPKTNRGWSRYHGVDTRYNLLLMGRGARHLRCTVDRWLAGTAGENLTGHPGYSDGVVGRLLGIIIQMGINYAKGPFIMGMIYTSICHSKWVHFQIPDTHIWVFLYWSRPGSPGFNHNITPD